MARNKKDPQRLLFVFAKTDPKNSGNPLMPVMYIERTLEEAPHFAAIQKEAAQSGQDWDYVFVAGLLGKGGELPSLEAAEQEMQGMIAAIQKRELANMFCYDSDGQPIDFLVREQSKPH